MGKIEIVYELSLAHPVMWPYQRNRPPITMYFQQSGNTVHLFPPDQSQLAIPTAGTHHTMKVIAERQGDKRPLPNEWETFYFSEDAAHAFHTLFNTVRKICYEQTKSVAGYPVMATTNIEQNPLVAKCVKEWRYDDELIQTMNTGGFYSIELYDGYWETARRRIQSGEDVPAYISFVLDAIYFAMFDPVRAVIMANAAWETAMRYYLINVAGKRDAKFVEIAESNKTPIPNLMRAVKETRGGKVLFEWEKGTDEDGRKVITATRQCIDKLPRLRNDLIHQGIAPSSGVEAKQSAIAIMTAIDWLFNYHGFATLPQEP
jgi:hypothetical protein